MITSYLVIHFQRSPENVSLLVYTLIFLKFQLALINYAYRRKIFQNLFQACWKQQIRLGPFSWTRQLVPITLPVTVGVLRKTQPHSFFSQCLFGGCPRELTKQDSVGGKKSACPFGWVFYSKRHLPITWQFTDLAETRCASLDDRFVLHKVVCWK